MAYKAILQELMETCPPDSPVLSNQSLVTSGERPVRIVWMYPDVLNLHGGRGDLMALMRFATMGNLPLEIIKYSGDALPPEGDCLYFCSGDLSCVPALTAALRKISIEHYVNQGAMLLAVGSTGGVFARALHWADGSVTDGLNLLDMDWKERQSIHGDDLWFTTSQGIEVMGNQIARADATLLPGQEPFGQVAYGYGNCGDGTEGAIKGNVIYTACLGPMLVRNPALAQWLLSRLSGRPLTIPQEDIALELQGLSETRAFLQKKMEKISRG